MSDINQIPWDELEMPDNINMFWVYKNLLMKPKYMDERGFQMRWCYREFFAVYPELLEPILKRAGELTKGDPSRLISELYRHNLVDEEYAVNFILNDTVTPEQMKLKILFDLSNSHGEPWINHIEGLTEPEEVIRIPRQ